MKCLVCNRSYSNSNIDKHMMSHMTGAVKSAVLKRILRTCYCGNSLRIKKQKQEPLEPLSCPWSIHYEHYQKFETIKELEDHLHTHEPRFVIRKCAELIAEQGNKTLEQRIRDMIKRIENDPYRHNQTKVTSEMSFDYAIKKLEQLLND